MYHKYVFIIIIVKPHKFEYNTISSYIILVTFNSCNMDTSVLPDMYTRITRAAGPRDGGVHIRQNTSAHVTTVM